MNTYDLIIIGTGSAGGTVSHAARKAGLSVAITDEKPFGGTCALRGCDPKKVLLGAADVLDWSKNMQGNGITGDLSINWSDLMKFKESFVSSVPENREKGFIDAGMDIFHGTVYFVSPNTIMVGNEELKATKNIVIAGGAEPRPLDIHGSELLIDSEAFLNLKELPRHIVFVGGGYISFEFAHLAARAGAKVTVIHRGARPFEMFDEDIVADVSKVSDVIGITTLLNTNVTGVEKTAAGFKVTTEGEVKCVEADLAIHGAGRVPATARLDLEKGNVESDRHGIVTNEFFQSISNPMVYAAGDVVMRPGGFPLTPVAGYEGGIVADNILHGNAKTADYTGLPTVSFTIPPIAMVGLTEALAKEAGLSYTVSTGDISKWYSSRRVNALVARYKAIVENDTNKILGVHLIGPHSEDTINLFALAMRQGITTEQMEAMMWAYPSHASDAEYML